MTLNIPPDWLRIAGISLAAAAVLALVLWLIFRKKPTPDELERKRRTLLADSGRLTDGMTLDLFQVLLPDGRSRSMLLFNYNIGGVNYECSQDITDLIDTTQLRIGFPCSVRYQPGFPQNSIVLAEQWSGLREELPHLHEYNDPEPIDTSHLHKQEDSK